MSRPKVLFCITVYDGDRSVKRCLESAARLSTESAAIEVLVLDDAGPAPGWSDELARHAASHGFLYYRTPRALGVPRLVNIGLLTAIKHAYDYVAINNSDLVFPENLLTEMLRGFSDPQVGSVTAFSNHPSLYPLAPGGAEGFQADQNLVDWLSETVADQSAGAVIDLPTAVWFSTLLPTNVVRRVGLLDPVFGHGYSEGSCQSSCENPCENPCENQDWSLRSIEHGYRVCLAPGVFVYRKSNSMAVQENGIARYSSASAEDKAIIELRHPEARSRMEAFQESPVLRQAKDNAVIRIIEQASRQFGYSVELGRLPRAARDEDFVSAQVIPREGTQAEVIISFKGFRQALTCEQLTVATFLKHRLGREPLHVNLLDREASVDRICSAFNPLLVRELRNYPCCI